MPITVFPDDTHPTIIRWAMSGHIEAADFFTAQDESFAISQHHVTNGERIDILVEMDATSTLPQGAFSTLSAIEKRVHRLSPFDDGGLVVISSENAVASALLDIFLKLGYADSWMQVSTATAGYNLILQERANATNA
jgi:hypothetical protein